MDFINSYFLVIKATDTESWRSKSKNLNFDCWIKIILKNVGFYMMHPHKLKGEWISFIKWFIYKGSFLHSFIQNVTWSPWSSSLTSFGYNIKRPFKFSSYQKELVMACILLQKNFPCFKVARKMLNQIKYASGGGIWKISKRD